MLLHELLLWIEVLGNFFIIFFNLSEIKYWVLSFQIGFSLVGQSANIVWQNPLPCKERIEYFLFFFFLFFKGFMKDSNPLTHAHYTF